MKVSVIGCGRWGSFIAWYLDRINHDVKLYGRSNSKHMNGFMETRSNGLLTFNNSITLTTDLADALSSDIIVISVNSQGLRDLMQQISESNISKKTIVLCMKGIEVSSGKRLSQIVEEFIDSTNNAAVWLGPGHVQEFLKGVPNCMVIDSNDEDTKKLLVASFSSELIRFYYGNDLIGNEVGAASKNVIGIAAGMLDGLGVSSLKGALMSRGTREIARLIKALGGNELSAYGLCHLGDYEATVFSEFSHNRRYGEAFVKGENFSDLAEGCFTVKALMNLSQKNNVELPICKAVYDVLFENKNVSDELKGLFLRDLKQEI